MTVDGAVVNEGGITFAIIIVNDSGMNDPARTRSAFQGLFPGMPLVLARQDFDGMFEYQGRTDLVEFLASVDAACIPWQQYTFA